MQDKIRKKEEKQRIQRERWSRWGHTRKPNFLVLALYAVFDWFADFGPMLRSLKQGVGKGARHSGIENMSIEERNRQFTLGYLGKVIHEKLRVIGIIGGFDLLQEVLKEIKKTS